MSTEIANQLPQHLQDAIADKTLDTGLEEMSEFFRPPRVKIVGEKKVDERIKDLETGTVILLPQVQVVCNPGESLFFTPIYTWTDYCIHNPWKLRNDLSMIRERTLDSQSVLAEKCRNMIKEPCPEAPDDPEAIMKYATHINFIVAFHGKPELKGIYAAMSFFIGEFSTGQRLVDFLNNRMSSMGAPIYSYVLQAHTEVHKDKAGSNSWMGFGIGNPTADSDISEFATENAMVKSPELYAEFGQQYQKAKENKERLDVIHDDADRPLEEDTVVAEGATTL